MLRSRLIPLLLTVGVGLSILPLGCSKGSVASPFGPGAGGAGGEAGMQGNAGFKLDIDAGSDQTPTLGGPCQDDGQCDDSVDCTRGTCDLDIGRCRFVPEDEACDDGQYCNGVERCDVRMGCGYGVPVACSDDRTCTIDVCIEDTQSCRSDPRDADGDGEPTRNCMGTDCDDANPYVRTGATEICGNRRDDNCDGAVDEKDCTTPEFDKCGAPLVITKAGFYDLDLTGTVLDYPSSCATEMEAFRDAVLVVTVPEGGPFDLDVTVKLDSGRVSLGTAETCGDIDSIVCEPSFVTPLGVSVARLLLRGLPAGDYPVYLASDQEGMAQVQVQLREAETQPGELCEAAAPLTAFGDPVLLRLPGYAADFATACQAKTGDAFLQFTLDEARDVTLIAEAQIDLGLPVLSLLDANCKTELTCRKSQPGRLFERNLPAGTYRVGVAATGPDDVSVRLETSDVSEAPPGEGCDDAQPLTPGVEELVDLSDHEDAVDPGCLVGAPDATFGFELEGKHDVALIGRFSEGDEGSVSLSGLTCGSSPVCQSGVGTQRALRYGLAAGSYRAIIEAAQGNPVGLSFFERPALSAVHVPFADDCDNVVVVPQVGGRFSGNTSNSFPDFSAGCDVGGGDVNGAPDQVLKLTLSKARRVVLDMQGSSFDTMLSVREGKFCPGAELPRACATGLGVGRSYLDLDLQAGDYFILIDGYDGASGAWKLNVFTALL